MDPATSPNTTSPRRPPALDHTTPNSPLNPAAKPFPIGAFARRISATNTGYVNRNSSHIGTPTGSSPLSPLRFPQTPSLSSNLHRLSISSSPGYQLRTPIITPNNTTSLPLPSPGDPLPKQLSPFGKLKSSINAPLRVKIPDSPFAHGVSPNETHSPSPLENLNYLQSIPASPPILPLANAFPLSNKSNSNDGFEFKHPYINIKTSSSDYIAPWISSSPFLRHHRLIDEPRRGSTLSNEIDPLDLNAGAASNDDFVQSPPLDDPQPSLAGNSYTGVPSPRT